MTSSIEIKYNTLYIYNTYTYNMYNYDIKYNVDFLDDNKVQKFLLAFCKRNVWKSGTPFGTLACQNEKLACHLGWWGCIDHYFGWLGEGGSVWNIILGGWGWVGVYGTLYCQGGSGWENILGRWGWAGLRGGGCTVW